MTGSVINRAFQSAVSMLAVVLLAACSDSKTTIIERAPVPVDLQPDDGPDHVHRPGIGRLLISGKDEPQVYVLDLQEEAIVADFTLDGTPTALYASDSGRYGIVVKGGDNGVVNFVDNGLYLESHGDHMDLMQSDPMLLERLLSGDRPAHVTRNESRIAVFFDGNAGAPANVRVLDEIRLGDDQLAFKLNYAVNQHGAAQARGDYLLATVRYPEQDPESTLPTRVALYQLDGDHYDLESEFDLDCPELHGSAQNRDVVAFGCNDGVLVIEQDESNPAQFQARKITSDQRIGSLYGHEDMGGFFGVGSGVLYYINTDAEGSITPIAWKTEDSLEPVGYAFADHGELFLVLDSQGGLTLLNTGDQELAGDRLQVTASENVPDGSRFELTVAGDGHTAYISDPAAREIIAVDIDHIDVIETFELDFTPHKLVWLGVLPLVGHIH